MARSGRSGGRIDVEIVPPPGPIVKGWEFVTPAVVVTMPPLSVTAPDVPPVPPRLLFAEMLIDPASM